MHHAWPTIQHTRFLHVSMLPAKEEMWTNLYFESEVQEGEDAWFKGVCKMVWIKGARGCTFDL